MIFTLIAFIIGIITIYDVYSSGKFKFEDEEKKEKILDDNK